MFVIKYPKPNNHPYKKKNFLFFCMYDFLTRNKKNNVNEIKLIIKKLYGGKLKEVIIPKINKNTDSIYNFILNIIYFELTDLYMRFSSSSIFI